MDFVQKAIDIFSVTMFCPGCEVEGLPTDKSLVAMYGGTSKKMFVRQADTTRDTQPGFTPHLIFVISKQEPVKMYKVCGVIGCGVHVYVPKGDKKEFVIQSIAGEEQVMALHEFNALRQFKDVSYYV